MAYSIPDWLSSLYGPQQQTGTPWTEDVTFGNQTTGLTRGATGSLIPVQGKAVAPKKSTAVGGFAARVQELQNAGWDYNAAIEMASAELDNQQFYADLNSGGGGSDGTAAAQITADAQRDIARMEVDEARYEADLNYRAAIDVVTRQVDADRYTADMAYRQAVDTAQINGDAARDVQRMDVDARRYEADSSYRQAVDVAQIGAYTDRMLGLGEIGLGYYKTLAEMQKNPADWVSYWYATQGKELPEGYQGAGIPEGLQLPSWLQGLYEDAGYEPNTWEAPVPSLGAQPALLGPASSGAIGGAGGGAGAGAQPGAPVGIGGTGGTWIQNLLKNIPSGGTAVSGAWAQEAIKAASAAGLRVVDAGQGTYQIYRQDDPIGVQQEARYAPGGYGAAANDYMTSAGRAFTPQEQSDIYNFYAAPKETQTALATATPENMARLAATSRYSSSTAGEKDALARATPEQLAALWRGGQTPSMSGGGRMTIREPAGIIGLHSGRTYATLAEEAPEEVNIKSQKKTAQEQGTQSYGGTGEEPRSFASGGSVHAYDSRTAEARGVATYNPSGFQSRRAMSAGSQHYGRRRKAAGHISGYGPKTEAAWETTPDPYTFNPETGVGSVSGDTSGTAVAAAEPTMPPWLKTLSGGGRQQYPAANLAGLPPAPSAQYMRGMSDSAFEGLQGVVQKGGGYIPDWLNYIAWLMPQGAQFARPSSIAQKY